MWIDANSNGIPGRDHIQHHHVRINSLPTLIRTSRGTRKERRAITCQAGCQATETAAHVIQVCHRTHGSRVKRYNAVCSVLVSALRDKGYKVTEEPHIKTPAGIRKPDIIAVKDGKVRVIDTQIVSGSTSIEEADERKKNKYKECHRFTEALATRENFEPIRLNSRLVPCLR